MRISLVIIFSILILFSSCIDKPQFPDAPRIEFENVYFVDSNTDSLVITLNFEDGDGDLGLTSSQNGYPYQQYNLYSRVDGEELYSKINRTGESVSITEAIHYSDKRTGVNDTLPPFEPPYNCTRWITNPIIGNAQYMDTLYFQPNPFHYNIFIEFLLRDTQGNFEVFDWNEIGCRLTYNGRFPVMMDEDRDKAIEGNLTYKMQGAVLGPILDRKIIKLRIYILDRALNKSNIVESQEFILDEITR